MLDLRIQGGTVVDGTGAPGRRADVGVRDGRIVAVGDFDEAAARTIDADGLVVAPGFVDIHTHYDAQLLWDPTASPSPLHGVTTVIGGNCGFTLAPLDAVHADYVMRMMARVEGMPLAALEAGVGWDWAGFGEWLDRLEGAVAVNAGFLLGHSTLRRFVMGERAVGEPASDDDLAAMLETAHASLEAGALGFSSSLAPTHNDGAGDPVPSRAAEPRELLALAGAIRDHEGTTLEFIPTIGQFSDAVVDLMSAMSLAANRPLNWNLLGVSSAQPDAHEQQLAASTIAAERGARVLALTLPEPIRLRVNLASGFVLDALPGWGALFKLPMPERVRVLSDPARRRELEERAASPEAGGLRFLARWDAMVIAETFSPTNHGLAGRTVGEIAAERGMRPFDALVEVVLADELRTSLAPPALGDDDESWRLRAQVWRDDRTVLGGSDAGAHLDMSCQAPYTTALLGESVRERGLLSLQEAVHLLTDAPARLYGLRGRGRIAEGWQADLVVFDSEGIAPQPVHTRQDLPGGAARLYAEATGVEHVLVNGVPIVEAGTFTGATPGTVLRSGTATETVTVPGGATPVGV